MKIGNSISAVIVLLFITHSARALDPGQPMKSYIQTRFTGDNSGLPDDIVNNIVQSQDGFLWTLFGSLLLGRFDGQRFKTLSEVKNGGLAMAVGPNGDLWVGTPTELLQIPAAFNQVGSSQAIARQVFPDRKLQIICMYFNRNGTLWVGTSEGLYRFENNVFSPVIPNLRIERIEESSNGNLLLTTSQGFMEWDGAKAVPHPEFAAALGIRGEDIFHVLEDSRGITWVCTSFGVARRIGGALQKLQPWGAKGDAAYRVYEDPKGNVWFAGAEGLLRATTTGLELAVKGMKARCMYGDRDGNLWVGTNGDGLYRFKDRAVRMFTTADGLPGNVPMTVLTAHDGTLWIGFNCGGLARFDGNSFHTYNEKDGLLNSCVFALAEDASNDLWIATWGGGAFRFHDGSFTQYSTPQGLPSDVVLNIVAARDGSVWFLTYKLTLSRLRNGQLRNYTVADGLSSDTVFKIYEDRSGGIWVGTNVGMDHLEGDRFVKVSSVPNDHVLPFGEDHEGALYITLPRQGLFRFYHGQLSEIAIGGVISMIETEQGDIWFNGDSIQRVPFASVVKQHERDDPLDLARLELGDGLISTLGSVGYPGSALTRDGKLWMATVQGLAMLDLPHLPRIDRKPVIYVNDIIVGRNQQSPGQELVLPPGTHHIELRFDAVEITAPEKIHLQYRLDGVDSEWLDVEPPGHATYSNIPKGAHAFHIRACNRDGIWDRMGMVYIITQQPYFYETMWFRLAMVATALLLVMGLYRLRLRQATTRLKVRFDERLAERTRIARELHDTLLQTVQGSKFVADDALEKYEDSVHVRHALERLSKWLGQATQEGRAALNSLRASSEETSDLAVELRRAMEECVINRSIAVKFSATGGPRDLHPIVRDEIYRIGYEAIRNACEHSSASELDVHLNYADDLTLQINDNGAGIEPAIVSEGKAGHFGLQGMRERAERIGSKFTLVSSPNAGTAITLVVPGNVIYRKPSATRLDKIKSFFGLKDRRSDLDDPSHPEFLGHHKQK